MAALEQLSPLSARAALMFLIQPVLSGLFALALVALAMAVFRPRRPWVRAALWLLPLMKIALDLAAACPAAWIGAQGVAPDAIRPGERTGTLSVGLTGWYVPVWLYTTVRLEYDGPSPVSRPTSVWGKGSEREGGLLHPGDVLYARIGRDGAVTLIALVLAISAARVGLRTVRLFAFRRWLKDALSGARPLGQPLPPSGWPRPRVFVVPGLAVPFATGFLSPRVMVPEALVAELSEHELAALLAHELAHLRRADPLVRVLAGYVLDVFWYVPGLSGCVRRFQAEREADCDDAAHAGEPSLLARALLKTHDWVHALAPEIPGLAPSWAPAAVEASTLSMRLKRLVAPVAVDSWRARALAVAGFVYAANVVLRSSLAGLY